MKPEQLFSRLAGLFLLTAVLLSSVQAVVFSRSFYQELYASLDLAEQIHVSQDDLETSIFMMTDYVQGLRDNMDGTIVREGQQQEPFNSKEIRHMKDVRTLWLKARTIMQISWILSGVLAAFVLLRKKWSGFQDLYEGLLFALLLLVILLIFFGFWWLTDFTSFWTWFHTVAFPGNTDWLLDPATDFMILICPEAMFSTMVFQIALRMILGLSGIWLVLRCLSRGSSVAKQLRALVPADGSAGRKEGNSV